MTDLRPMTFRATFGDIDAWTREARKRLNRLLRDDDYLSTYSPGKLLSIGEAAERLAQAIEEAEESRRIRELP